MLIRNRLLLPGGGWSRAQALPCSTFIAHRSRAGRPAARHAMARSVRKLFPDEGDLVIDWLAHRVQHPGIKINHVLLLGGGFGIGKDTLLEPAIRAVGLWNSTTISPAQFVARFNGHLKSVLLRIAEARDGEHFDRYSFYDAIKLHGAAPPDTIRMDEKNRPEYDVANVVGIAITANRMSAFYIEPDDRRHAVAWSRCQRTDFPKGYFDDLYRWYHAEGFGHVAAYFVSTISRTSTRRHRRARPTPSTTSSAATGRARMPRWPTRSTSWRRGSLTSRDRRSSPWPWCGVSRPPTCRMAWRAGQQAGDPTPFREQ